MYIVTHKFTQHVKKNQFFFLRGIILPLSPLHCSTIRAKRNAIKFFPATGIGTFVCYSRGGELKLH
jgi:hypothetical protein